MKYHNITKDDMLNGDGLRVVLWVSGCSHHCNGCHNGFTWDPDDGLIFDSSAEKEIFDELEKSYIAGITFSGGDPLFVQNRKEIGTLIKKIKNNFPSKTIWLYTGYQWNDIKELDFIKYVDVLIDGKFIKELKQNKLKWRGSSNQNVIDVKSSLNSGNLLTLPNI